MHKSIEGLSAHKNKEITKKVKDLKSKWKVLKPTNKESSKGKNDQENKNSANNKPSQDEENYLKILKYFDNSNPSVRKTVKKNIYDALIDKDKAKPCILII